MPLPDRKRGPDRLDPSATGELPVIRDKFRDHLDAVMTCADLSEGEIGAPGERSALARMLERFVWDGGEICRLNARLQEDVKAAEENGTRKSLASVAAEQCRAEFLSMYTASAKGYVGAAWFGRVKPKLQLAGILAGRGWDIRRLAARETPYELLGTTREGVLGTVLESGFKETQTLLKTCHQLGGGEVAKYLLKRARDLAHWGYELDHRPEWAAWLAGRMRKDLGLDDAETRTALAAMRAAHGEPASAAAMLEALGESLRHGDAPGEGL